ncbi:MAG: PIG-L family deacetylase [Pyrinomonadaceae bacterium]|nr:PIG-L family deacetylase [Pyrinomonadaceae bacterium]MCX7639331.1 PIG-L family deacetylase [Pyrinomonadaceae bacterium]MDW8303441.1 PIG-L family deacetylase [Acidobacteriota bacterium]
MKRNVLVFILLLFFSVNSQVRPVYDEGAAGLGLLLRRLQTTASALHVGAHPDDEDSALLAYLARRQGARTAYLSLNRGEGGQNVIGPELFEPLGIIRTEELLQARKLDGAEQFFTRVMDFGFSKTLQETARIWGEDLVLADVVRIIRLYRPLVLISRFTGTPADGHGHHQLAGYLTLKAFKLAADPKAFPEQIREGLRPWQPLKLYVSRGFFPDPENQPSLQLDAGEYDFLLGKSYYEIAIEGRSQHKSQEMGGLELRGKQLVELRLVESLVKTPQKEASVFDGIDTSISGIAQITAEHNEKFVLKLKEIQKYAEEALKSYSPFYPQRIIPALSAGFSLIEEALQMTENQDAKELLRHKQKEFAAALLKAHGIKVDALSETETLTAGDEFQVAVKIFAPESVALDLDSLSVLAPQGWSATQLPEREASRVFLLERERGRLNKIFKVKTSENTPKSEPYWLRKPRSGFVFAWDDNVPKGMPFEDPIIKVIGTIKIGSILIPFEKEVEYRFQDPVRGELRRKVDIVPMVSIKLDKNLLISSVSSPASSQKLKAVVTNNSSKSIEGTLRLKIQDTKVVETASISLKPREQKTFSLNIPLPEEKGDYRISAEVETGGKLFNETLIEVSYPHIQTHRYYKKAESVIKVFDLKIEQVKVGYIMGSGDEVPEAIRRMGLDVELLSEEDLALGDLSRFDVIAVGIRASQTRSDFVKNHNRLIEYVKNGGVLIVQYQQQDYVRQGLPPFPAKMDVIVRGNQRLSNLRVTDENAPVKILVPEHPIFNFPNKITDEDWQGWVQERNLYCFTEFDSRYTPLLESHDEGEPPNYGGMLYAEIGKGKYIYTAYSWFRQLPAGVVGAYRIFANMLSLPKAK